MKRKLIKIFLTFFLLFDIVFAEQVDVTSDKYILYNMSENKIIDEKNPNKKAYIASLTKIMTVIVSIENIDNFNDKITITNEMLNDIEWDVAVAGFSVGQQVTYNDLLYGAILSSGADAVNALAISISGSKDKFVTLMNKKVQELKLENTHFANVVGLYDVNNYSSAYDVSQLLIYALKNDKFKSVFTTKKYTFTTGKTTTSTIVRYGQNSGRNISYITGAKTGYIDAAGYCLATTATINDVDYLLVTLNADSDDYTIHIKDSTKIYNYFSSNYAYHDIVSTDDVVVRLKSKGTKDSETNIYSSETITKYLKKSFKKENTQYEYNGVDHVSIFTKEGTKLGTIKIICDDEVLDEFDLLLTQKLEFNLFGFIKSYIIQIVLVLVVIFNLNNVIRNKKKYKK